MLGVQSKRCRRRSAPAESTFASRRAAPWLARVALVPLLFLLGPRVASATMFVLDDRALVDRADTIVLGAVRSVTPRWEGRRIVSDVTLDVQEAVKGAPPQHLTMVAPGGKIGDIVMRVIDGAQFRVGDRAIVFMQSRGGVHRLVGLAAGKLDVRVQAGQDVVAWTRNGAAESLPLPRVLDELRALAQKGAR